MRTNIEIDDKLMAEAQKASGQPIKRATVEEALRLLVRLRRQQDVARLSASILGAVMARSRTGRRLA